MLRDRRTNQSTRNVGVPMMKVALMTIVLLTFGGLWPAWSAEQDDAALIKAMSGAKVTLQQGLTASEHEGRPISGKFEMEDGKLQLSIYTEKNGKFFEVIVDHMTGFIGRQNPSPKAMISPMPSRRAPP
jgi:hypothetical protein